MATTYPASLDAFVNPSATDKMDTVPHDVQHANANDAIEAIQAKIGVTGSAVAGTVEKRLADVIAADAATAIVASNAVTAADAATVAAADATNAVAGAVAGRTISASGTALLSDNGVLITVTAAAALTIPPDASVAWPVNAMLSMYQSGAGVATFAAGAGVTLRSPAGVADGTQYGIVAAMRVAANEWALI